MTIKDVRLGLRAFLLADDAVSSVVGGARIFPLRIPQGATVPCVVYTRISNVGDHHMRGPSGLSSPRVQVDCYALTADEATSLADKVKWRLDGYRGAMPYGSNSPQAEIEVLGVFFDSERELYDDATKFFRVSRDYFVHFREF